MLDELSVGTPQCSIGSSLYPRGHCAWPCEIGYDVGVAASRRLIGAGHRLEAYAMLQLLLGLGRPSDRASFKIQGASGVAGAQYALRRLWLPTALILMAALNCGNAGLLVAALLGIAMYGRTFDPRLCPIFRGRLYLERIDHCFAGHAFTLLERNRRCFRIYACHAIADQFFDPGANLDHSAILVARRLRPSCSRSLAKMRSTSNGGSTIKSVIEALDGLQSRLLSLPFLTDLSLFVPMPLFLPN
jgi:hypothetical protein